MSQSHLEKQFEDLWRSLYPNIVLKKEYQFLKDRKFRFDFAHRPSRVAIEIQGGIWMAKAGHNTGGGLTRDFEKLNLAILQRWRVFFLSDAMITKEWLSKIKEAIARY